MKQRARTTAVGAKVVGYIRVSTGEQADSGAGLAAQRAAIEGDAARRGWEIVAVHEDAGASGKSLTGRVGLSAALDAVSHGQADVLLVSKLDRLSRSLVDFAGLLARSQKEGWAFVALDLGVDTSTPAGAFVAQVLSAASEWERKIIGDRTRDALAAKKAAGVRLGRRSQLDQAVLARIVRERAGGSTLQAIADGLNRDAVPTTRGGALWRVSTIRSALSTWELNEAAVAP
ncbi:MAG: recombinase family protein [Mycobacteriales bacterium]